MGVIERGACTAASRYRDARYRAQQLSNANIHSSIDLRLERTLGGSLGCHFDDVVVLSC
jgi:hypothetical protein